MSPEEYKQKRDELAGINRMTEKAEGLERLKLLFKGFAVVIELAQHVVEEKQKAHFPSGADCQEINEPAKFVYAKSGASYDEVIQSFKAKYPDLEEPSTKKAEPRRCEPPRSYGQTLRELAPETFERNFINKPKP